MEMEKNLSVTETELKAMEQLWDLGCGTIKELAEGMYGEGYSFSEYTTVQKLLDRLERKGCVRKERTGRVNQYRSEVERKEILSHRLEKVADELCEGSLTPLILNLASRSRLSEEELGVLKGLIADHSEEVEQ